MPRLLATALVLVFAVLTLVLVACAADEKAAAPSGPMSLLTPGQLKPTAPYADFNEPGQSSSGLVSGMHMRAPEKILALVVTVLLVVCVVMFAFMLRQVYGAPAAKH
jgi:hypothetical protein